ncbi:MAG: PqqD family protein [Acholeplasmataceae bacterium]|jgi:hypothetical protein|nr:PqqD family protein [Acholeplasmataceae bacterium]
MRIKEGYVLREVVGQNIVVPTGEVALNFNGVININATGKFLWEKLQKECSFSELVQAVLDKYEINQKTAEKDVEEFLNILKAKNILA